MSKQKNSAHNQNSDDLALGISGFVHGDLFAPARLQDLHEAFNTSVKRHDPDLYAEFEDYRQCQGEGMPPTKISDLLVKMAPYVGRFVAELFHVEKEHDHQIQAITDEMETIFEYRNLIVMKLHGKYKDVDVSTFDLPKLNSKLELLKRVAFPQAHTDSDRERAIARVGATLANLDRHYKKLAKGRQGTIKDADSQVASLRQILNSDPKAKQCFALALEKGDPTFIEDLLRIVQDWSFIAQKDKTLSQEIKDWISFKAPARTDFDDLIQHKVINNNDYTTWSGTRLRRRDGFALTDKRYNQRQILYEVDHCIYCHERDTDSCSKGMRNKKTNTFKINPLGVNITACPLEEKISEMHILKRQGDNIGALALIAIDNPMCPGTGHRICNDCMKGCIYQKTEAVDIPQIETNVLTDVLFMPYGFEIYSLLTHWNPLNVKRPYALPYNGKNILVVGLGPAGYTLAHFLLNEGFGVVGIDALKLEPLPTSLTGDTDTLPQPIKDFNELYEDLDKRSMAGFGGVAEYGITVRWDKNFLKVIYLNLVRNKAFRCYGGVRFGGTITIDEAWDLGFDHIAIATGAGKPTIIGIKNNLIRGIRKASDFLMALQLTGAAKTNSLTNLQVRLPAGVIGGGLTGIDTTTELLAYYPVQVEKILQRYEKLVKLLGEDKVQAHFDEEERVILDEFLTHGRAIRDERNRAAKAGEDPNFLPLLKQWGGATLFYRKSMKDSPAYRQNHEEITKALEEGINFAEGMSPTQADADNYGHLNSVRFQQMTLKEGKWDNTEQQIDVPLRSLFIAAGTSPNTIYESEHPNTFKMDSKFFQRYQPEWANGELKLVPMDDATGPKLGKPAPLTSYQKNGKKISFYGDNHPVYAGNVVKAMASAKDGYPYIVRLFDKGLQALNPKQQGQRDQALRRLHKKLDQELIATVTQVNRLTPTIIEVVVKAPMQARKFSPGQFYRIQNLEAYASVIEDTVLAAEGIALTGAWVDKDKGLISLIALEMGSSSRLCATWKIGDPLVVMGVTGTPTHIPTNSTVMLVGGGLGNAVLFSIGKALRAAGNKVIYFAGYKHRQDVFKVADIEQASDLIVWSVDKGTDVQAIPTTRAQDKSFVGNVVEAMVAYAKGELGDPAIRLKDAEHMIVIGSDRMMAAVKQARFDVLTPFLNKKHQAIGSINSPMQCMMKGVCAQCLCKHIDPKTGEVYFVYSCYNQDQELDRVDFENLNARLRQNTVQEKLSDLWLNYLLEKQEGQARMALT